MSVAPKLRLAAASFYERPVTLRLPFRFGVVTLTEAPQVFVRARVRMDDGREGEGVAAELLAPKWFDKSPALSNAQNFDQLRRSLTIAREHLLAAGEATAFGLSAAVEAAHHAVCAAEGLNGLIASFGLALMDRAILDALGRVEGASAWALARDNRIGLNAATAPDLAGFDFAAFLAGLKPAASIHARHTVGLVDDLTRAETAGKRLDDGLPESLEEVIAAYGHRYFKLKVAGAIEADIDRLTRIAAVLDRSTSPYHATLDGNEQFESIAAVTELWGRIGAEPRLARLKTSLICIEQPVGRARALDEPVHALAGEVPFEVDESDADIGVFPRARALGYCGISSKSCKGVYRALLNRARVARWNAEEGGARYFMSAEDLTTQAGVAVQQDLALATLIGATHVEKNGHHYVDGMSGVPDKEQRAFLAAHPDLYSGDGDGDGPVRLAIRDGQIALSSLDVPGLAVGAMPDFSSMRLCSPPLVGRGRGWGLVLPPSRLPPPWLASLADPPRKGEGEGMRTEGLSINLATVREQWGFREAVEGCLRHGITAISPWRDQVAAVGLDEAARIIKSNGLRVTGYCRGGLFPASDAAGRQAAIDDNKRAIDEAAALGADCLVLIAGGLPKGSRAIAEARKMVADGLAAILPHARAAKVPLAIEPLHPMYAADRACVNTLAHALDLCAALGDGTGVAIDVYHLWWDPNIAEQIARAGREGRILAYHICDWLVPTKDLLLDRGMMGDGVIDLPGFRRMVETAGFHGPQEVEIFSANDWWKRPGDEVLRTCVERFNTVC